MLTLLPSTQAASSESLHALVAYLSACAGAQSEAQKVPLAPGRRVPRPLPDRFSQLRLAEIMATMALSGALLALRSLLPVAEAWNALPDLFDRLPHEMADAAAVPPLDDHAPVPPSLPLHLCLHPPTRDSRAVLPLAERLVGRIASHLATQADAQRLSCASGDQDESEQDVATSWACLRVLLPCVVDIDSLYAFMTSTTHEGVTELAGKRLQKELIACGDDARVLGLLTRTIAQVVDGRLETRERSSALTCAVRATLLAATAIDSVRHAQLVASTVSRMMDIVESPTSSEFSVVHALNIIRLCFREAPLHGQCAWLDEDALHLALSLLDHASFSIRRAASLLFLPLVLSTVKLPRLRAAVFIRKNEHVTALVLRALETRRHGLYFPIALLVATFAPDADSWQPSAAMQQLVHHFVSTLLADRHAGVRRLAADALAQLDPALVLKTLAAQTRSATWNQVHGQLLYRAKLPPMAEPDLGRWLTGDDRVPFPVQSVALECHPSDALVQTVVARVENGLAATGTSTSLGYDVFLNTLLRVCTIRGLAPVDVDLVPVHASRTVRERHVVATACAAIVNEV